ncbi:hypothetical protein A3J90_06265 [candidate division WOR-1 bacterium RIFOXYC2_FULL_37_10]|uniref:Transglycosylase SLT domain-containing protein n=1 Tax=candidate division WOR-1 bacterium RIFOXYB2_FULL_37_13 TaxID=1802579 RepID=A0A1F4SF20_UNCSA|nr:MAG: hypothetical protein A2310_03300 [candidate division WOR-1 bacterium RIFOXYB2_FULL_37_13]OGC35707.1 MAG: hypothetical protein A3J90_06265 [candidate division WOR-1 bacterium RIFOXYC2_FULL_37_10]
MESTIATIVILVFTMSIFSTVTGTKSEPVLKNDNTAIIEQNTPICTTIDSTPVPKKEFADCEEGELYRIRNFVLNYGNNISELDADEIYNNIIKHSRYYNLNPKIVAALIARESKFNKFAVSSSGAQGLGQLLPSTAHGMGIDDPFNIDQNVMGTTRYLRSLIDRFQGENSLTYALASYLEGPNAVKRNGGFKFPSKYYIEDIYRLYDKI